MAAPGVVAANAYVDDVVEALLRFSGPVIGAINGLAITGGVEIALACDVLICASDARFADSHAQVGLLPGWGGSARMIRRIGLHRAKELALTGRFLGAEEALAWGFVNRIVAPERLRAEAEEMARQMLSRVPEGWSPTRSCSTSRPACRSPRRCVSSARRRWPTTCPCHGPRSMPAWPACAGASAEAPAPSPRRVRR
jgi:enoyl-CoA hydratase/carnithine racemase